MQFIHLEDITICQWPFILFDSHWHVIITSARRLCNHLGLYVCVCACVCVCVLCDCVLLYVCLYYYGV
jgi:hypothetical protein